MFIKYADGCFQHNKYQMKWVLLFLSIFIFGISTFWSNYSSTSHWHIVNIFPENLSTNAIPCFLQLKPKAFLWMDNNSVQFIFQTRTKFAEWGWGPDSKAAGPSF